MDWFAITLTVAGLCLFEVVTSIDNAIINAEVLTTMGQRARRWFLTGEIFDGRRAAEIGLVSEAVPDGEGRARLDALRRQAGS